MRQISHPLRELKPLQNRPARRIQTVAAHFLARKFFPVEHDRSQPGEGAKRGTARSGRSAADDCNVEKHFNFMLARSCGAQTKHLSFTKSEIPHLVGNDKRGSVEPRVCDWRAI